MFPAPQLLSLLIVTTPLIFIFDGPVAHGVVTAAAAILVASVALRMRPGEVDFLSSVIRPLAIIAALPALWMLIQLLPLKSVGLANPIWNSAAEALGRPLIGSISIDPGATLVSLARYLSIATIAFAAAAVAVDRDRSQWILFSLVTATTLIAAIILASGSSYFKSLDYIMSSTAVDVAADCAGLGVPLAVAACLHTLARGPTTKSDQSISALKFLLTFMGGLFALAICTVAVIVGGTGQTYFAVACGLATLVVGIVIRRFEPGPWGYSAIVAIALVATTAVIALHPGKRPLDPTLMFAARAPTPLISVTQRTLVQTSWTGTGAGTFAAVLPIYQDIDELVISPNAPTAAAATAVEMGRPFLWVMLIAAIVFVVTLLRGSLRRRRDSFYSTAGASCLVTFVLLSFGNAGLFGTPVLIIVAATIGLAVAQSKSRST
jgi:hypothetical protein